MRTAVVFIALLCMPIAVLPQAINLPQSGDTPMVTKTENYFGRCGDAIVHVYAVSGVLPTFYTMDINGALEIANPQKNQKLVFTASRAKLAQVRGGMEQDLTSLRITTPLSDHNGIACITTRGAHGATAGVKKLLTWSTCAGTACSDEPSFTIIDPDSLSVDGAAVLGLGGCNTKCATRKLGYIKLPLKVR